MLALPPTTKEVSGLAHLSGQIRCALPEPIGGQGGGNTVGDLDGAQTTQLRLQT